MVPKYALATLYGLPDPDGCGYYLSEKLRIPGVNSKQNLLGIECDPLSARYPRIFTKTIKANLVLSGGIVKAQPGDSTADYPNSIAKNVDQIA